MHEWKYEHVIKKREKKVEITNVSETAGKG